jgi:hypothetical protein
LHHATASQGVRTGFSYDVMFAIVTRNDDSTGGEYLDRIENQG